MDESQRILEIEIEAVRLATEIEGWKRRARSLAQLAAGIQITDPLPQSIDTKHLSAANLTGTLTEFGNVADFLDAGNTAIFLARIRRPG